jgi:hypothetical protein
VDRIGPHSQTQPRLSSLPRSTPARTKSAIRCTQLYNLKIALGHTVSSPTAGGRRSVPRPPRAALDLAESVEAQAPSKPSGSGRVGGPRVGGLRNASRISTPTEPWRPLNYVGRALRYPQRPGQTGHKHHSDHRNATSSDSAIRTIPHAAHSSTLAQHIPLTKRRPRRRHSMTDSTGRYLRTASLVSPSRTRSAHPYHTAVTQSHHRPNFRRYRQPRQPPKHPL